MGCNTSQELKTKDGAAIDAVSNVETEPSAPQLELADGGSKSSNNHTNHAKSNSIISNGDAKTAKNGKGSGISAATTTATNGKERSCDKAEITELNDDDEDEDEEPEVEILIPHHHHHHGSKKFRRNPLKNLDLDFKFDVNSF